MSPSHAGRAPLEVGGSTFVPWVLSLSGMAEITDPRQAREHPELAVLAAVGHGRDSDTDKAVRMAIFATMASAGLDEERSARYFDPILHYSERGRPPGAIRNGRRQIRISQ